MNTVIGVDLGGTKVEVARVLGDKLLDHQYIPYDARGSREEILELLLDSISQCMDESVTAIGIGVPGLVDVEKGTAHNLTNISSWRDVPIKELLEDRFNVPVSVNNDSNCFVLGEKTHGAAKIYDNIAGITLGTGLGVGLVIHGELYQGLNCAAGEFGQVSYLRSDYEAYCSSQFFRECYGRSGEALYNSMDGRDGQAEAAFYELGRHVGSVISSILLAYAPDCIVIGGSISNSYRHFQDSMFRELEKFPYQSVVAKVIIGTSTVQHAALLGAAALCDIKQKNKSNLQPSNKLVNE